MLEPIPARVTTARGDTAANATPSPGADPLIRISADVVFHRDALRAVAPVPGHGADTAPARRVAQLTLDLDDED